MTRAELPGRLSGLLPPVRDVLVAGGAVPVEARGAGPPLLLLHGWACDRHVWRGVADELARDFRLLMPDRRGFGRATAPPGMARELDDVQRIADAFGCERLAIAGHSQGGRIALAFAAAHPDRVSAVIAIGAPVSDLPMSDPERMAAEAPLASLRAVMQVGAIGHVRQLVGQHPLMRLESSAGAAVREAMLARYDGRDLLAGAAPLQLGTAELARIAAPTLAIAGAHEPTARRRAAALIAATVPAGRRLEIAGAGHLVPLDAPAACAAAIRSFLEDPTP